MRKELMTALTEARPSGLGCNQKSVFSSLSLGGRNKALPAEGFVTIIFRSFKLKRRSPHGLCFLAPPGTSY